MSLTDRQLYLGTLFHTMAERTQRGLSPEEEAQRTGELDRLWGRLSPEEQLRINSGLTGEIMPEHVPVLIGSYGLTNTYEHFRAKAAYLLRGCHFEPSPKLMWPPHGCVKPRYLLTWIMPLYDEIGG